MLWRRQATDAPLSWLPPLMLPAHSNARRQRSCTNAVGHHTQVLHMLRRLPVTHHTCRGKGRKTPQPTLGRHDVAVENVADVLTGSASCVQVCRTHAPALLLLLTEQQMQRKQGSAITSAELYETFRRYGNEMRSRDDWSAGQSTCRSAQGTGRGAPLLTTTFGVHYVLGAAASSGDAGQHLHQACQVAASPPQAVSGLARLLADQRSARVLTESELSDVMASCLRTATPTHVASIVLGLQVPGKSAPSPVEDSARDAAESPVPFPGHRLSHWHTAVSPALAKRCLQTVADTIREQRGRGDMLPSHTLQALHACALCELPCDLPPSDTLRVELAVVGMSALKYAPFAQLQCLYSYLRAQRVTVPAVLNKFLANCGILFASADLSGRIGPQFGGAAGRSDTTTAALKLDARVTAAGDTVREAVHLLANSGRDVRLIEEGLVHGCSALSAVGLYEEVKKTYQRYPSLRSTPHVVAMHTAEENVAAALDSLHHLATSRPEGWVRLPPVAHQAAVATCELVGRRGSPQDVKRVYKSLVGFHNAGMLTSQVLESVLAGICSRMREVTEGPFGLDAGESASAVSRSPTPRAVLERVIPITKTALTFVGDDINTDMVLTLLETALETGSMAVPLTSALMWTLRQATSLSIRELFLRVDSSTHNLPFLYYYALCFARDRGLLAALEHLSAVWRVDSQAILQREPHLAPPYKLWKCAGCGRLNSDRFNYCVCSTLRNGFVVCGHCGYGQDERWPACLSCGGSLEKENVTRAVVRKAWTCSACNVNNPARQMLLCFRCSQPTGPLFLHTKLGTTNENDFCACVPGGKGAKRRAYDEQVGFCRDCGQFKCAEAARRSFVWKCEGCEELRSSLERACPSCPHVDCLPFARTHRSNAARQCVSCAAELSNALSAVCPQCGGADVRGSLPRKCHHANAAQPTRDNAPQLLPQDAAQDLEQEELILFCPHCGGAQRAEELGEDATASCEACGAGLQVSRNGMHSFSRTCPSCRATLPPTILGALCPQCLCYLPHSISSSEWHGPEIQQTFALATKLFSPNEPQRGEQSAHESLDLQEDMTSASGESAERTVLDKRLKKLCMFLSALFVALKSEESHGHAVTLPIATLSGVRVGVLMELNTLAGNYSVLVPRHSLARRATALMRQLMSWIDFRCGVRDHSHAAKEGVCPECLGGHPVELCIYYNGTQNIADGARAASSSASLPFSWTCGECGANNVNDDVCRYLCTNCLTLRPVVQDLFPAECWECAQCHRANMEFETYCIHCGGQRPLLPVSSVTTTTPGDEPVATQRASNIPFLPSRCALCGLVYLEANCPLCTNHLPDVAEAKGVVCSVGRHHAYIQPLGSTRAEDRVLVDERIMRGAHLLEGKVVHYLAELRQGDCGVGFRAIHVR